jgi:hypothetical protein
VFRGPAMLVDTPVIYPGLFLASWKTRQECSCLLCEGYRVEDPTVSHTYTKQRVLAMTMGTYDPRTHEFVNRVYGTHLVEQVRVCDCRTHICIFIYPSKFHKWVAIIF